VSDHERHNREFWDADADDYQAAHGARLDEAPLAWGAWRFLRVVGHLSDAAGAIQARVNRLVRIGFEVRAELQTADSEPWVQLTRGQADALELASGSTVWLRPARQASTLAAP